MNDKGKQIQIDNTLINNIKEIIVNSRKTVVQKVNTELIATYWQIGKEIASNERRNKFDNQSSRQIILLLSKQLTKELGKGFSRSNLFNMRKFYLEYSDVQTLSGQISWSHICELLIIEDKDKRSFYEKEISNSNWSIRELKITDAGQLNTYLNYFKTEINEGTDNPPIGIILSTEKDEITAEYILGGMDNKVFASKFTYVLPDKAKLIEEVKSIVGKENL